MPGIDDLVERNREYVGRHGHRELPTAPSRRLAVLTCMDSRLDLFGALGLDLGEAHLIRNAGGQATEDALRSLLLSQRLLGTRSVMVVHHTRCGLEGLDEAAFAARVADESGVAPGSPSGPSPTSTPTCARRWPQSASRPCSTRATCAGSSSTSTTACYARSGRYFLKPRCVGS